MQATKDEDLSRLERIVQDVQALQFHPRCFYQNTNFGQLQHYVKEIKEIVLTLFSDIKNETLTCLSSQWHEKRKHDPQFLQFCHAIPTLREIFLETKEIQDNHVKDIERINYFKKIENFF